MDNFQEELLASAIRLPLAALLGTVLALRPRRNGTPERQPAVVQTQIILAVVGSLIMLVVGASLARAFGIVGAANLIRYRSKIDDPKDAVVMLCALSVGLAAGVGLYGLAVIGTLFIAFCLWIIEGFEPQTRLFELTVKMGDKTTDLRPKIEEILRRYKVRYELRTTAEDNVRLHGDDAEGAADRSRLERDHGAGRPTARAPSSGTKNRKTKSRSDAVKLIVQPEAGVVPVVQAIKAARKTIDVFIFRFDRDRDRKSARRRRAARRARSAR